MAVVRRRRASRLARLLFYGGALVLAVYLGRERLLTGGEETGAAPAPAARRRPAASLLAVAPSEMRSGLRAAYRLRPDARCVGAFSQMHAWLTGASVLPVSAAFVDGQWRLTLGGAQVATLPELPDFDDCMRALRAAALGWTSAKPATPGQPRRAAPGMDSIAPRDLLDELRALDGNSSGGRMDARRMATVARDLVYLTAQSLDLMETTDGLRAKAWAFVVLADTFTDYDVRRETALLAYLLDYSEAAGRRAADLPEGDPVRLFIRHDDARLATVAASDPGRMLMLGRLAENRDFPGWLAWVRQHYDAEPYGLPVLRSALNLHAFVANAMLPDLMPYVILGHLFRESGDSRWIGQARELDLYTGSADGVAVIAATIGKALGVRAGDLAERFEATLDELSARYRGPVLDAEIYRDFYEAYFYSALRAAADFHLDQRSSIPDAEGLLRELTGATAPRARAFARWYGHLVDARKGSAKPGELVEDLGAPYPFGPAPRFRTYAEVERYVGWGKPQRFDALKGLVGRMDSRPTHAQWLAARADSDLWDMNLAETLSRHLLRVATERLPESAAWSAQLLGDAATLERLIGDPAVPVRGRLDALRRLGWLRAKDPAIETLYRRLWRAFPDSWSVAHGLADHLETLGRHAQAREVFRAWLARDVPDTGLDGVVFQTGIARTYYEEGAYEKAWEAISPVVESWQGGALERAALIRERLDDAKGAQELFLRVTSRYPDNLSGRLALVEFLWRQKRYPDAATALRGFRGPMDLNTWATDLRKAFHEPFTDRPDAEPLAAFAALKAAGFPHRNLAYLTAPFRRDRRFALTFQMRADLTDGSLAQVEMLVETYQVLKDWKGKPEALAWLKSRIPAPMLNPASMIFHDLGQDDLLWEVIDHPEAGPHPEWVWLVRAASAVRWGATSPERRRALEAYFGTPRDDQADVLANFLLGKGSEDAVWRRAADARRRAEAAYVVGVRRLCDGAYREASDWFRTARELANENIGEFHWASNELRRWKEESKTLDRIKPRCGPAPPGWVEASAARGVS